MLRDSGRGGASLRLHLPGASVLSRSGNPAGEQENGLQETLPLIMYAHTTVLKVRDSRHSASLSRILEARALGPGPRSTAGAYRAAARGRAAAGSTRRIRQQWRAPAPRGARARPGRATRAAPRARRAEPEEATRAVRGAGGRGGR